MLALGSPLIIANVNPLARQDYDQGVVKCNVGNYFGAIADFNNSIEINLQYALAYDFRGSA